MQTSGFVTDQVRKPRFDIHMNIFECRLEIELSRSDFLVYPVEPTEDRPSIGGVDNALIHKHLTVSLGGSYILSIKAPIDIDRRVDPLHSHVGTGRKPAAPHIVRALLVLGAHLVKPKRYDLKQLGLMAIVLMAIVLLAAVAFTPAKHTIADNPPLTGWMEQFSLNETPLPVPETAMQNSAGETVTLNSFRGKVLLVNFWATWCAPCIREMPSLDRLQAALGGSEFAVIAVNSDREGSKVARPFLEELGIRNLDLFIDEKMAVARALGVKGLPATFLVSTDGHVLGRLDGLAEWDSPEAAALIRHYLKQG